MSKELRALNRIKDFMSVNAVHWKQDVEMIETALKRLEKIDNILPMEIRDTDDLQSMVNHYLGADYQKLKAFEIIKEKGLDIREFRYAPSLYGYNICKNIGCKELAQEEYDLLKEVLL